MIPKFIHYCWLSGNPVPADYERCMATWKQKLPDYKFMRWDKKKFDINSVLWVKQAFEVKLYACASDYIRLYAVYKHGGIYLDMDMEVVKPFDSLLSQDLIAAYENHINENIEAGCFGAVSGHPYIKKCMEYFEKNPLFDVSLLPQITEMRTSERHEFIDPLILPEVMKNAAEEFFKKDTFHFYPRDYFTAKNVLTGVIERTENTFTIHHFATQHHSEKWRKIRENEQKIRMILGEKSILSRIIIKFYGMIRRIHDSGFINAMKYYRKKYIAGGCEEMNAACSQAVFNTTPRNLPQCGSFEKKVIAFFEPRCTGIVHLDSASSIIDMFSKIFPEHTFLFYTEKEHGELAKQRVSAKFEPINITIPKSQKNRMEWLKEVFWDFAMMRKIGRTKPEYIICMGNTWQIVLFAKLFQRNQKIVFFFH